jgi:hypothetical protein
MGFVARGRWGGHERNPPVERLREILQELDIETKDLEHPDARPSGVSAHSSLAC